MKSAAFLLTASLFGLAFAQTPPAAGQPETPPAPAARPPDPPQPFKITRLDPGLDAVVEPGATHDTIATIAGKGAEGPMWRDGKLWVSDQKGGGLYAIAPDGAVTSLGQQVGGPIDPNQRFSQGPNGLAVDKDGTVLVMRQALRDIGRLNKDGTFSSFLSRYEGKRLNAPNDMVFGPDGTLWFTDPAFSVPGYAYGQPQPAAKDLPYQGVFRYKDGKLDVVVTDMPTPNGIGLSPDGKTLYVGNTNPQSFVRAYTVDKDGGLSDPPMFLTFDRSDPALARGYVDGLKVDGKGNVWTTGPGGISIVSPAGVVLGRIQLPANSSNLAFGEDFRSVFFASGPTIYRMRTVVRGQVPLYYKP